MKGLCGCGCGQRTTIATGTDASKGWVKGEPIRFILYHAIRVRTGTKYKRRIIASKLKVTKL